MNNKFLRLLTKHRLSFTFSLFALTILLGIFIFKIQMDFSITSVSPNNNSIFKKNIEYDKLFGGDESMVVVLTTKDGVYDKESLNAVYYASLQIEKLLNSKGYFVPVQSISTVYGAIYGNALSFPIKSQDEADKLKQEFEGNLFSKNLFTSKDLKVTTILSLFPLSVTSDSIKLNEIVNVFTNFAKEFRQKYPDIDIKISGQPYIKKVIGEYNSKDVLFMFPIAISIFAFMLIVFYKDIFFTVISLFVIIFSIVFVFGIKAIFGSKITLIENTIPIFLIAVSSASSTHVLMKIRNNSKFFSGVNNLLHSMNSMYKPILLSGLTTSLGFFSLIFSSNLSMQNMGLFLSLGIVASTLLSIYGVPILSSFKIGKFNAYKKHKRFDTFLKLFSVFLNKYSLLIAAVSIAMILFSFWGVFHIKIGMDEIRWFKKNIEARNTAEFIEKQMGGINNLQLVIKLKDGIKQDSKTQLESRIEVLRTLEKVELYLNSNESKSVYRIISPLDFVYLTGNTLENISGVKTIEKGYKLPANDFILARMLKIFQANLAVKSDYKKFILPYLTSNFNALKMVIYLRSPDIEVVERIMQELSVFLKNVPSDYETDFIGDNLRVITANGLINDQIKSLVFSLLSIYILLFVTTKSAIDAIIILIPISLSIFFNFGVISALKMTLNPATAIVSAIGVGIGVDYSIHLYYRLKDVSKNHSNKITNTYIALKESALSIFMNAISVSIGFSILIFSNYEITKSMGFIISLTMLISCISSLLILPSLFFYSRRFSNK